MGTVRFKTKYLGILEIPVSFIAEISPIVAAGCRMESLYDTQFSSRIRIRLHDGTELFAEYDVGQLKTPELERLIVLD
jgi:hypothetical protein